MTMFWQVIVEGVPPSQSQEEVQFTMVDHREFSAHPIYVSPDWVKTLLQLTPLLPRYQVDPVLKTVLGPNSLALGKLVFLYVVFKRGQVPLALLLNIEAQYCQIHAIWPEPYVALLKTHPRNAPLFGLFVQLVHNPELFEAIHFCIWPGRNPPPEESITHLTYL